MSKTKLYIVFIILSLISFTYSINCLAISVSGSMTQSYYVNAGDERQGVVTVRNPGQTMVEVRIYQRDYQFFADGRNIFHKPGTIARSNARWIQLNTNRVTIPPDSKKDIHYVINVPQIWQHQGKMINDGKLKGTYWSIIMVEPVLKNKDNRDKGVNIQTLVRYGLQVVTQMNTTGKRDLEIINSKLIYDKKHKQTFLEIALNNTGSNWLNIESTAELYNREGHPVNKITGASGRLYPGTSKCYRFNLSQEQAGSYQILVSFIDNKNEKIWGAQYQLELAAERGVAAH